MDVGMMMVFASYGWENCSDDRVWNEEIRLARIALPGVNAQNGILAPKTGRAAGSKNPRAVRARLRPLPNTGRFDHLAIEINRPHRRVIVIFPGLHVDRHQSRRAVLPD